MPRKAQFCVHDARLGANAYDEDSVPVEKTKAQVYSKVQFIRASPKSPKKQAHPDGLSLDPSDFPVLSPLSKGNAGTVLGCDTIYGLDSVCLSSNSDQDEIMSEESWTLLEGSEKEWDTCTIASSCTGESIAPASVSEWDTCTVASTSTVASVAPSKSVVSVWSLRSPARWAAVTEAAKDGKENQTQAQNSGLSRRLRGKSKHTDRACLATIAENDDMCFDDADHYYSMKYSSDQKHASSIISASRSVKRSATSQKYYYSSRHIRHGARFCALKPTSRKEKVNLGRSPKKLARKNRKDARDQRLRKGGFATKAARR